MAKRTFKPRRITIDKPKGEVKTVTKSGEMTMAEFKAWLEGFKECFKGSPNKAQWTRIQERLDTVTTQTQIRYEYQPYWWPSWYRNGFITTTPTWQYRDSITTGNLGINASNAGMQNIIASSINPDQELSTTLLAAATDIGKEEAKEFTA